jgi:hypothetical protein
VAEHSFPTGRRDCEFDLLTEVDAVDVFIVGFYVWFWFFCNFGFTVVWNCYIWPRRTKPRPYTSEFFVQNGEVGLFPKNLLTSKFIPQLHYGYPRRGISETAASASMPLQARLKLMESEQVYLFLRWSCWYVANLGLFGRSCSTTRVSRRSLNARPSPLWHYQSTKISNQLEEALVQIISSLLVVSSIRNNV